MKKQNVLKRTFIIRLENNGQNNGTYRVNEELFYAIKKLIEPYRSISPQSKKVLCIEPGQIFENAKAANKWLVDEKQVSTYHAYNFIKSACKEKRKTAYGYHWKFIE